MKKSIEEMSTLDNVTLSEAEKLVVQDSEGAERQDLKLPVKNTKEQLDGKDIVLSAANKARERIDDLLLNLGLLTQAPENLNVLNKGEKYIEIREELKRKQEQELIVIEEAKKIKDRILEKGKLAMTEKEYNEYFVPEGQIGGNIKQQIVGNCGGLAGIHGLSCFSWFEFFCRISIQKIGENWEAKTPFMNDGGRKVIVGKKDISSQWNGAFLQQMPLGGIDVRPRIGPIKALEGMQVLEAVLTLANNTAEYTKIIKGPISDIERRMTEGIAGDDTLMIFGGEIFEKCGIEANWKTHSGEVKAAEDANKYTYRLSSLDEENMAKLDHYLEHWNNDIYLATAVPYIFTDKKIKIDGVKQKIFPNHWYSIADIDSKRKVVIIGNPHDTSKPIELSFDQFKENFTAFRAVKINGVNLLKKLRRVEQESFDH